MEAPLKFRAPGITVALGVGIGRLVLRMSDATFHSPFTLRQTVVYFPSSVTRPSGAQMNDSPANVRQSSSPTRLHSAMK